MRTGEDKTNNWREIWETFSAVTPEEWENMKRRLKESHERAMATIDSFESGTANTTLPERYRFSFTPHITSAVFVWRSAQSGQR